jgi:hypothetical protein
MKNRFRIILMATILVLVFPIVALAQVAGVAAEPAPEPSWLGSVLQILGLLSPIAFASLLSALKGSNTWWMKIIDTVALNWGKARNDPAAQ